MGGCNLIRGPSFSPGRSRLAPFGGGSGAISHIQGGPVAPAVQWRPVASALSSGPPRAAQQERAESGPSLRERPGQAVAEFAPGNWLTTGRLQLAHTASSFQARPLMPRWPAWWAIYLAPKWAPKQGGQAEVASWISRRCSWWAGRSFTSPAENLPPKWAKKTRNEKPRLISLARWKGLWWWLLLK